MSLRSVRDATQMEALPKQDFNNDAVEIQNWKGKPLRASKLHQATGNWRTLKAGEKWSFKEEDLQLSI